MKEAPSQKQLLWLQVSQSFAIQLALSVFYPFLKERFSMAELSLQSLVQYSVPLLLPFIRVFWIRRFILAALIIAGARVFIASQIDTRPELYLAAFLAGMMLILFWVPYEILYFRRKAAHGTSSAWYFGAISVSSIFGPITAGMIADHFGYSTLFQLAAALMVVPFVLALRLPEERVSETLHASLHSLRGIRHLIFFDGFLLSATMSLVSLSLLSLTKTATAFGAVGTLASLAATLVSFFVARRSDQKGHRFGWIAWTSVASAILLAFLGWQTTFWWFSFFLVLYTSVRTSVQPIINALPMDLRPDHTKLYIARQFLLSVGRVTGFGLTWLCALTAGLRPMYAIYAMGFVAYIFCVRAVLRRHASA